MPSCSRCIRCGSLFRNKLRDTLSHPLFQLAFLAFILLDVYTVFISIAHEQVAHLDYSKGLDWVGIGFLSLFGLEASLRLFSMGLRLLKDYVELFDVAAVYVSILLEVLADNYARHISFLFRLMRIGRVLLLLTSRAKKLHKQNQKIQEEAHSLSRVIEVLKKLRVENEGGDVQVYDMMIESLCLLHSATMSDSIDEDDVDVVQWLRFIGGDPQPHTEMTIQSPFSHIESFKVPKDDGPDTSKNTTVATIPGILTESSTQDEINKDEKTKTLFPNLDLLQCKSESMIGGSGRAGARAVLSLGLNLYSESILDIDSWSFDIFKVEEDQPDSVLFHVGNLVFAKYTWLMDLYGISKLTMCNFLRTIEKGYRQGNPYHNAVHAADVLHGVHHIVVAANLTSKMEPIELLSLLIAAIIHDYDHPGVNNDFLQKSRDPLAIKYNDRSICENHHISSTFEHVLSRQDCNILAHMDTSTYIKCRSLIIDLVLATDMKHHFSNLALWKSSLISLPREDIEDPHRLLDMQMILHSVDVGNPARPHRIYQIWASRVMKEFRKQGELEHTKGMTVSPFCSFDASEAACQRGFIQGIVKPLYQALVTYSPDLQHLIDNVEENSKLYGSTSPRAHKPSAVRIARSLTTTVRNHHRLSISPGSPFSYPLTTRRLSGRSDESRISSGTSFWKASNPSHTNRIASNSTIAAQPSTTTVNTQY